MFDLAKIVIVCSPNSLAGLDIVSIVRVHAAADTETVGFSAVGVDEGQMGVVRFAVGAFSPSCSPQYSHPQNHSNYIGSSSLASSLSLVHLSLK